MYERMLNQSNEPDLSEIKEYLGEESYARLQKLENILAEQYTLMKELRFPFGNGYGWGYKFSHKSAHLCYVFFEQGSFTVTVQIGDKQVAVLENVMDSLTPKARELWEKRYPCGGHGGWVHDRILEDRDVTDAVYFIHAKKVPLRAK